MKIKRKRKDKVEKAFDILAGYCEKHICCDDCRFCYIEKGNYSNCFFGERLVPCDWQEKRETSE